MRVAACSMPVMHCLCPCKFSESCRVMSCRWCRTYVQSRPTACYAGSALEHCIGFGFHLRSTRTIWYVRMPDQLKHDRNSDDLHGIISRTGALFKQGSDDDLRYRQIAQVEASLQQESRRKNIPLSPLQRRLSTSARLSDRRPKIYVPFSDSLKLEAIFPIP